MGDYYILDESGEPQRTKHLMVWASWLERASRQVANETVNGAEVSTVFIGLPPHFWETMVFGGAHDQYMERCSGPRQNAIDMHARVVALVKGDAGVANG